MTMETDKNDIERKLRSLGPQRPDRVTQEAASYAEPFVMTDSIMTSDGGQLLMVQYVDLGASSEDWSHVVLVKGIEAEYSLAHSRTIRISSPHRFQDLGETLIRDDQEGRAHNRTEEHEKKEYVAERHEQEQALHQLGMPDVNLGSRNSGNSDNHTESYAFGAGSWIFCAAIQPTSEVEWQKLRRALPPTYNDYTTIHQPRKFAQALGLMFMDQIGPNGRDGKFTHSSTATKAIVSLHDCQKVIHGPVLYTNKVYDFLDAHQNSALAKIYPLFVKDVKHQDQREYRFVIVGNDDLHNQCRDILVTGMTKDALLPVGNSSSVRFERIPQDQRKDETISVTPKRYSKQKTQTRRKKETRTRIVSVGGEEREREEQTHEVIVTVKSESLFSGDVISELLDGEERHTGHVIEQERESTEVDGVPIETSNSETVRIGYIKNVDDADEFFTIEDKKEAEEVIEHAKMLGQRVLDSPELRNRISQLFETTLDPVKKRSVDVTSAAWHGLCALVNLHSYFGDVVEEVDIEDERFISICLKPSTKLHAKGKLLVGPLGTYAYVLRKGEECTNGYGGEETKLVLFPDEEDEEKFAEFGWQPREPETEGG